MSQTTVPISRDVRDRLKEYAALTGQSQWVVVDEAVNGLIDEALTDLKLAARMREVSDLKERIRKLQTNEE